MSRRLVAPITMTCGGMQLVTNDQWEARLACVGGEQCAGMEVGDEARMYSGCSEPKCTIPQTTSQPPTHLRLVVEAVHLRQHLVERLVALVVALGAAAARGPMHGLFRALITQPSWSAQVAVSCRPVILKQLLIKWGPHSPLIACAISCLGLLVGSIVRSHTANTLLAHRMRPTESISSMKMMAGAAARACRQQME